MPYIILLITTNMAAAVFTKYICRMYWRKVVRDEKWYSKYIRRKYKGTVERIEELEAKIKDLEGTQ